MAKKKQKKQEPFEKWHGYEQFPPNKEARRDFTLIVNDGLAYRDAIDTNEYDEKAWDILVEATTIIADKTMWMPIDTEADPSDPVYYRYILSTDDKGNRCEPTSSFARRWTLLGALDLASQKHYSPDSKRIAFNALQCAIEGWISLGDYHDKRRQQEQRHAIAGIDDYIDHEMESEGHERCLSILEDAKKVLAPVRDKHTA